MDIALPFGPRFLVDRLKEWCVTAMTGLQADNQRTVVIGIQLGPAYGNGDLCVHSHLIENVQS